MASISAIKESSENVVCDETGRGTHIFTVTNTTASDLQIGFQILADGSAQSDWFRVEGEGERPFAAGATDQVAVSIEAPAQAPLGKLTFRLLAFSTAKGRSDEDFTEGPTVSFEKPEPAEQEPETPKPRKSFPWWIVAATVAVVLIAGGVIGYFVMRAGPSETIVIAAASFKTSSNVAPGAGRAASYGSDVVLNAPPYNARPNMVEYDFNAAAAGKYSLSIEVAAAQARPVRVLLNGALVNGNALNVATGGWTPEFQKWVPVPAEISLRAGANTLRIERDNVFPHIRTLKFEPPKATQ